MKKFLTLLAVTGFMLFLLVGYSTTVNSNLSENIVRLHVLANSDSVEDQELKLQVRDAVLNVIREDLNSLTDVDAARVYLREQLPKIQQIANDTLELAGFQPEAVVSLCREAFDTRKYDTFCSGDS